MPKRNLNKTHFFIIVKADFGEFLVRLGLFGLPGAGKGTQAEKIAKQWAIPHISTGEMFREMEREQSPLGIEIRAIVSQGSLVPDDLVTKMAFERLAKDDCARGFVLDGFPRTLAQAKTLEVSPFSLNAFLLIEVERAEIVARLSKRRVCGHCNSVFGVDQLGDNGKEPKCPNDGQRLLQREDDAPEAIDRRLTLFQNNFEPIMKFYGELGRLFRVDGSGSSELVFERICNLIGDIEASLIRDK